MAVKLNIKVSEVRLNSLLARLICDCSSSCPIFDKCLPVHTKYEYDGKACRKQLRSWLQGKNEKVFNK